MAKLKKIDKWRQKQKPVYGKMQGGEFAGDYILGKIVDISVEDMSALVRCDNHDYLEAEWVSWSTIKRARPVVGAVVKIESLDGAYEAHNALFVGDENRVSAVHPDGMLSVDTNMGLIVPIHKRLVRVISLPMDQ